MYFKTLSLIIMSVFVFSFPSYAENESKETATSPQIEIRDYAQFFDESLNDMPEESDTAKEEGKKGILLMFEMDECPFCKRMKKTVLNRTKIQDYFKKHFRILSRTSRGYFYCYTFEGEC